MKNIHIFALGGTIAYLNNNTNRKSAEDLLSEMGEFPEHIHLTYEDLLQKASSDLTIKDIFLLAKEVKAKTQEGIDGIVITQGTDTMEETSFLLDLLIDNTIPIVFTGALRHAGLRGAEGDANLFSAILVASSHRFHQLGTLIVIHDEIHVAKYVRKNHTQSTSAFETQFGPIGYITEGIPKLVMKPNREKIDKSMFHQIWEYEPVPVFMATMSMGEEGNILSYVREAGYQGMVIEGLGGGHVSKEFALRLPRIIEHIPVIMSSRIGRGEVLKNTYRGYHGSEEELIKMGCIYSGILDSRKSRLLLSLLLTVHKDRKGIREAFHTIGELVDEK